MTVLPIKIYKGLTFGPLIITAKDINGVAYTLTGWTAYAEIRRNPTGEVLLDMLPIITNAATGEITITLARTGTDTLSEGIAEWDMVLKPATGELLGPFIGGGVTIVRGVTQP